MQLQQLPNEVFLKQKAFFQYDTPRAFQVLDLNQNILIDLEEEKKYNLWQLLFKSKKPFNMELIFQNNKFQFLKRSHLLSDILVVFDKDNNIISIIQKKLFKDIKVFDKNEKVLFTLKSDRLIKKHFDIFSSDSIGEITKQSPKLKEVFTDADTFYINFPFNINIKEQITLIATAIFIDSIYFDD